MSFAFSTILIFLLIFPGVIYRRLYNSKEFSKDYLRKNTLDEVTGSILWGILIQGLGVYIVTRFFHMELDTETVAYLITGAKDDAHSAKAFAKFYESLDKLLLYYVSLIFLSGLAGYTAKAFVRKTGLDRKSRLLRFDNEWHYILSGEILEFPELTNTLNPDRVKAKDLESKYVDVLIKIDSDFIIYSGFLIDYHLSGHGGLDMISLKGVRKKLMDRNGKFLIDQPLNVDVFTIPYNQIMNLSINYYVLEELDEE